MRKAEVVLRRGRLTGTPLDDFFADRISYDKFAIYAAVNAIVCAMFQDKDNLDKSMKRLWQALFPEDLKTEEMAARKAAERLSRLPDHIYVSRKKTPETRTAPAKTGDEVPIKPGIRFGPKPKGKSH